MSGFFQEGPVLGNQYRADSLLRSYLHRVTASHLREGASRTAEAAASLATHAGRMEAEGADFAEASARAFALGLSRVVAASLMLEHAEWCAAHGHGPRAGLAASRWCQGPLATLVDTSGEHRAESRVLALDEIGEVS